MTKTDIKITLLEASENRFLTQISEDIEPEARVFAKKLYLSVLDSADNYKEVTETEMKEIINSTKSDD